MAKKFRTELRICITADQVRHNEAVVLLGGMGFAPAWCARALAKKEGNIDLAVGWLLSEPNAAAAQ
jgi:uncharacterized UBP type Zn finger protein